DSGWVITDVLRNADGSPYALPTTELHVVGSMVGTGESWLWVWGRTSGSPRTDALFHRLPGGAFLLDDSATSTVGARLLAPELTSNERLVLRATPDGKAYGLIVSPNQERVATQVVAGNGTTVKISTATEYAVLTDETWHTAEAQLPPHYEPAT